MAREQRAQTRCSAPCWKSPFTCAPHPLLTLLWAQGPGLDGPLMCQHPRVASHKQGCGQVGMCIWSSR